MNRNSIGMEFWFDFGSTYSYLTCMRIERVCSEREIPLVWRPFLLGPIFKESGWSTSPFNVYPDKGRYMWKEMERYSKAYALNEYRKPSHFPRNGLLAARVSIAAQDEPWIGSFVSAVFQANFEQDRDIGDKAEIASVLEKLGLDALELIERAERPETKQELRAQNERAKKLGIFGAPTFSIADELFWGNDRLEEAVSFLSEAR